MASQTQSSIPPAAFAALRFAPNVTRVRIRFDERRGAGPLASLLRRGIGEGRERGAGVGFGQGLTFGPPCRDMSAS